MIKLSDVKTICLLLVAFAMIIAAAKKRPHVIVIVADDLGWNDVSFHGSSQIPTPNIDSLAKEGIVLNNYYVCPMCSPSRGSLMTGLYPIHTGLQHNVIYVEEPWGLPLKFTILPQHLKTLGYATHAVGKWHLGFFRKEYTPTYRGFDSHLGLWSGSGDYYDHTQRMGELWGLDFHHNMTSVNDYFGKYSTHVFSDHAKDIINQHDATKPLFLYVAYQAVHSANSYLPLQAPEEYVARFPNIEDKNRRIYAGMVSAMDDGIGAIFDALRKRNMLENSIILFTSDNGGAAAGLNLNAASNWPLRGVKATLWEGGVRGAAFLWSPLIPKSASVSMNLMHITDWLPTLFHAAGGNVSSLGEIDGIDMWNSLVKTGSSPRKEVLLNIDPIWKNSALRVGNYKVIQGVQFVGNWDDWYGPSGRKNGSVPIPTEITCGPKPEYAANCTPGKSPCLFDISQDPCEYNNLAESRPELLSRLLKRLSEYNATAVPPGNPPRDPLCKPKYYNYQWTNWRDYDELVAPV